MSDPTSGLDRESLIAGLNDLIERIRAAEIGPVRISIVGGAALALSHVDRRRTVDVDARLDPHDALVRIAERIAVERDWPEDWLNSNASQFFPDWGKSVDWRPLYDRDGIRVEVAPADALLAMKLRAAMSRPGRDTADIVSLVAELDIESADEAESIFSAYYPGDALNDRVYALVERAVAHRSEYPVSTLPEPKLNPKAP
ncbi:hypothetical protein ACFRFH_00440 [Leifsonia sp. NPDC056824]|uniref:hypothetical protein n=1 Tax=Leifsonia sp. NPDC056824 TaxID=3345953 RepID=UPI0036CE63A0